MEFEQWVFFYTNVIALKLLVSKCFYLLIELTLQAWKGLPEKKKYDATHRMKIQVFWLPIMLQWDKPGNSFHWALRNNIVDKK